LEHLGPGASYLKAASYLLPLSSFSETRSFLLRTSELILQDDSGIPFRDFSSGEWVIQLYGSYADPLPVFKLGRDPLLDAAYRSGDYAGPLPFGTGYHVNAASANLLLATRRGIATAGSGNVPPAPPSYDPNAPVPKPTPAKIRKALPVPVRKALPVPIKKAIPAGTPNPPEYERNTSLENRPFPEATGGSVPETAPSPPPASVPLTSGGKPVD
jgi:hypothetical protein